MNVNDSAWVARSLVRMGWQESSMEEAKYIFINTCSVREKPEHKLFSVLGVIRDVNPHATVAVAGCVAQQVGEKIWARNAHVRLVLGSDGIVMAPKAFERLTENPRLRLSYLNFTNTFPDRPSELVHYKDVDILPSGSIDASIPANNSRAFVNIVQGCDNYCAYCIVPYTRGPRKSRSTTAILDECKEWLDRGIYDITLLGQNVNVFGQDTYGDGTSFVELVYKVAQLPNLKRLHMITPHPRDFSDGIIQAYADLPVLAPRLHLPLQAGSDGVLKRMGRGYTAETYLKLVDKLKHARPDLALSTDIIVGFPGESEAEFQETLQIVEQVRYVSSFSFCYSDRPGTRASTMSDKIDKKMQLERLHRLMALQDGLSEQWLNSLLNVKTEVLLEAPSRKPELAVCTHGDMHQEKNQYTSWQGHDVWGNTINLLAKNGSCRIGEIVPVHIIRVKKHSLFGELIEKI